MIAHITASQLPCTFLSMHDDDDEGVAGTGSGHEGRMVCWGQMMMVLMMMR